MLPCDQTDGNNWIKLKLVGTKSNRSAIGARVYCATGTHRQMDEVRSGGSYISQSDFRIHFGLGRAESASIEVRWPSGAVQKLTVKANQILKITEPEM